MASYSELRNKIFAAMGKRFVTGDGEWTAFEFYGGPDDETEKGILAVLRGEGSIDHPTPSLARFTATGYAKYKNQIDAANALGG